MKKIILIIAILFITNLSFGQKYPYKDADLPVDERVDDLLSRMTLEEKFWQLFMIPGDLSDGAEKYKNGIFGFQISTKSSSGNVAEQMLNYKSSGSAESAAIKGNKIQKYFVEETRLGIPIIIFDEALHGLVRDGATAFPQSIALAATWNRELMSEVGHAIAMEVKTRGIRQILSPVLNIARDVRWGRTEETYGEDPFLTTQMGVSFISEFEKIGIITTPKHFIANVGDGGRDSYPIHFNERQMEEVYFPAFKAVFQKANAQSVMTSYNSFDGSPCSANNWLLNKKLKDEWGFKGFVISDAGATGGANVLHFTTKDYAESTESSIENGLDVIFQTSYSHYPLFYEAFEKGMVDELAMNEAVRRVLRAKFNLGLFEKPYIEPGEAKIWNGHPDHRKLSYQSAQESIVLLKNKNKVLPLPKDIKKIAIIGSDATEGRLGGYSGPGNNIVSIHDGIMEKLNGSAEMNYVQGCGRESAEYITIPSKNLFSNNGGEKKNGLFGEYFNNPNLEGKPKYSKVDPTINFRWTLYSPDQKQLDYDWYSARWSGKLVAPNSEKVKIGIEGNDGYRLYIDGEIIIDNWLQKSFQTLTVPFYFEEGKEYDLKIEFHTTTGNVWLNLLWDAEVEDAWKNQISEAVELAQNSDAAILTVGIEEGEFRDRAYLSLPGHQEELIKEVAKTGTPVVVVLVGGSAITMNNWINDVPAILDVWYPGEAGGYAVADVLFGDYNPAGRLPITFPIAEAQLPLYYNHKPTGRGDDYINLTGQPLFPFGFGLSYTSFEYSDISITKENISVDETTGVRFTLKNSGVSAGDEVVQLYIKDLFASVVRPIIELKGFQRIHLAPGESKEVTFEITPELLTMLDINLTRIVEPGDFRIMIGASSKDIKLRGTLTVE